MLESLGELVTTLEVPLAITLVTIEMSLGESTPITTFNPETLVEMSLGPVENPLSMQAPLLELSMQALLLELSQTMDQDLITILPEMSASTLIRMSTRQEQYQIGSGSCTTEKATYL